MAADQTPIVVSKRGAEDSGKYFRYMAEFIGFTDADAGVIKQTKQVIEKHLPDIVAKFYTHLLHYPPTRKFFLKKDGSLDNDYVELRMRHLTNFWLRTADGVFDDDFARYIDYVGRAHTSRGADPNIYINERYVIGQVGMVQHAISEALTKELRDKDPDFELLAVEAWDKLMMVILEMLSRAYGDEKQAETFAPLLAVDEKTVAELAEEAFEKEEGLEDNVPKKSVAVARVADIPDGERKIVHVEGISIGVFHHEGKWFALRNSCIHRGGPAATGTLQGDILTCPWHGFQYDVTTGRCLADPSACLDMYEVDVHDGELYLEIPDLSSRLGGVQPQSAAGAAPAKSAQFRVSELRPGSIKKIQVGGADVAVFNVDGQFYATQNECTHAGGPLDQGDMSGKCVTCFMHGSQFDVTTGKVVEGPAEDPLKVYKVTVDGDTVTVDEA
jgi:nitrite reductase (NADH) small subunit